MAGVKRVIAFEEDEAQAQVASTCSLVVEKVRSRTDDGIVHYYYYYYYYYY